MYPPLICTTSIPTYLQKLVCPNHLYRYTDAKYTALGVTRYFSFFKAKQLKRLYERILHLSLPSLPNVNVFIVWKNCSNQLPSFEWKKGWSWSPGYSAPWPNDQERPSHDNVSNGFRLNVLIEEEVFLTSDSAS